MKETKICSSCKTEKSTSSFYKNRTRGDGFQHRCIPCQKAYVSSEPYKAATQKRLQSPRGKLLSARYTRNTKRSNGRFTYVRGIAICKGKTWDISKEEYTELISKPCAYCDGPLPYTGVGLDRIDNELGYSLINVNPCCWTCNVVRGDRFTVHEMKTILGPAIKRIRELRGSVSAIVDLSNVSPK